MMTIHLEMESEKNIYCERSFQCHMVSFLQAVEIFMAWENTETEYTSCIYSTTIEAGDNLELSSAKLKSCMQRDFESDGLN